jgi:uncharacterized protein involved in high-affinity Fe2+ transport
VLPWTPPPCVRRIVVPAAYSTVNASRGLARALHYASLHSDAAGSDWVVHLASGTALRERTARNVAVTSPQSTDPLQVDAVLAHVVDEAHRLSEVRRHDDSHLALRVRLAQGPQCIGRAGGGWLAFLATAHRAGESLSITRCQV